MNFAHGDLEGLLYWYPLSLITYTFSAFSSQWWGGLNSERRETALIGLSVPRLIFYKHGTPHFSFTAHRYHSAPQHSAVVIMWSLDKRYSVLGVSVTRCFYCKTESDPFQSERQLMNYHKCIASI